MNTMFSTGQVARILNIPSHRIQYAHQAGQLEEPFFRFLDKRCYTAADIHRVAAHFGVTITDTKLKTEEAQ